MSDARWHILGAGAIGCLFATALQRSGTDVSLILRDTNTQSFADIAVSGGALAGEFRLPVFNPTENQPITHLVVATKAYDVITALTAITPHLADQCSVLLLVNGMGLDNKVRALAPQLNIYCGTTTEGAYRTDKQHVHHAGRGHTRIGRCGAPPLDTALDTPPGWFNQWQQALQPCDWDNDIDRALWSKMAVNCVINPLTALHRCPNGDLARLTELAAEVRLLCAEVSAVTRAAGYTDIADGLQGRVDAVIKGTAENRSSMLQDIERGRPTEIQYITGFLLDIAEHYNIPATRNRALLQAILHHA